VKGRTINSDVTFPSHGGMMVLALEIFDEKHAIGTLQLADQVLRGPLHMKTLDPEDL